MENDPPSVIVEIVAKKKGCMLCDLALAILEEIATEFEEGVLKWEVVDVSDRQGIERHETLGRICGRKPAVPSIVINKRIAFDHIPEMEALTMAIRKTWESLKR
ncbi:MAG: hypothetical protein HY879_01310 [Deltaproteobacteria bacterium]|nr:hypothetical protein [Deltaproteobacteria bacterium]